MKENKKDYSDRDHFQEYISSLSLRDYAYLLMNNWYTINYTIWANDQKMYSLHNKWDEKQEIITFWFHPDELFMYLYDNWLLKIENLSEK